MARSHTLSKKSIKYDKRTRGGTQARAVIEKVTFIQGFGQDDMRASNPELVDGDKCLEARHLVTHHRLHL